MKKSVISLQVLLLFFALISFSSCTSDSEELNESTSKKNLSNPTPENPLEIVGILHNEALASYMNEITTELQNGDWDNIEYGSEDYIDKFSQTSFNALNNNSFETDLSPGKIKHIYENMNINDWSEVGLNGILSQTKNALTESETTSKDKEFTENLLNDIFEALENSISDEEAFSNLELVIAENENLILSQEWNENETYALGALAVAKHSSNFWKNFDFDSLNQENAGNENPKPESSIIVGADVAGYVGGGVVGGISGSFAGPAGTVGGVLGGKVVGSWVCSGAAATGIAIYKAWKDFFG